MAMFFLIYKMYFIESIGRYYHPEEHVCLDPPAGFDITFFGKAFKSYLHQSKTYYDALDTCQQAGGTLANIKTQESFLAARAMAGIIIISFLNFK